MQLDTEIPEFLQRRVAGVESSTTAQDIQLGAQMYQQVQQMRNQQRQLAIQEEAQRLKVEGNRFVTAGAIELGRLMEEGGINNLYGEPAFEGKLWSILQRYPQLQETEVFQGATKVVETAKTAKARAKLLETTYDLRGDATEQRHLFRLDEIDAQLEKALATENLSQEGRLNLESMRHNNRQELIRLRPSGTRPAQLDLDKSDQMLMDAELDNLKEWRSIHPGTKHDAEYQQRLNGIEQKYSPRRKSSAQPAASTAPAPTAAAPVAAPIPPPAERKGGTVYQTPKGPFRWNGTGWEAP